MRPCSNSFKLFFYFPFFSSGLNRAGKVLFEIPIPAQKVTAVAFGGPNLDILYVTTGGKDDADNINAGCLFKVTGLNAKGFPGVRINI